MTDYSRLGVICVDLAIATVFDMINTVREEGTASLEISNLMNN
jgi:hypothetical protein